MSQPALLVDCLKIITWLEQRRKLPKDWYNYQKAAQQKIKILLKDIQQYQGSNIENLVPYIKEHAENFHYCDVVRVVDMLVKSKWAENRSLVFGYGDKRVKQWVNLKKFMDNKQISIVNIAKFINQGLSFDLPSLDKNIELLDNQIATLKRKIDFNTNAIYQQQKQQQNQRIKMGFKTPNPNKLAHKQQQAKLQNVEQMQNLSVMDQIPYLIRELPKIFGSLEQKFKQNIANYYNIYLKYCENNETLQLNMLNNFIQKGNCLISQLNNKQDNKMINYNDVKYRSFYNWKPFNQWGIQDQSSSSQSQSQQKPQNVQTILQNRQTRQQLIQDLNQLLYFYQGLKSQQSQKSSLLQIQTSSSLQLVASELQLAITALQHTLCIILTQIIPPVEWKNNAKVYQILVKKFKNYTKNIRTIIKQNQQYNVQIQEMKIKREEIVAEFRKLKGRLLQSKNQCEKYLGEFVKREVRITGEINKFQ